MGDKDIQIIINLYWNQKEDRRSQNSKRSKAGLPIMFNMYSEKIFKEPLSKEITTSKADNNDTVFLVDNIQD